MKNIIILMLFVLGGIIDTQAQYAPAVINNFNSYNMAMVVAGDDTATNTDQILQYAILDGKYDVTVKFKNTEVSGAPGGTAYVQGSWDGSTWVTLNNGNVVVGNDTVTLADGGNTGDYIIIPSCPFRYLRGVSNHTGTAVTVPVFTIYYRKED